MWALQGVGELQSAAAGSVVWRVVPPPLGAPDLGRNVFCKQSRYYCTGSAEGHLLVQLCTNTIAIVTGPQQTSSTFVTPTAHCGPQQSRRTGPAQLPAKTRSTALCLQQAAAIWPAAVLHATKSTRQSHSNRIQALHSIKHVLELRSLHSCLQNM